MDILSETTHYISHYLAVIFVSIITLVALGLSLIIIIMSIIEKEFGWNEFGALLCCLGLGIVLTFATVQGIKQGATVTYKATVTDFNEVYNNGYEITGRDGEMYILKKTND